MRRRISVSARRSISVTGLSSPSRMISPLASTSSWAKAMKFLMSLVGMSDLSGDRCAALERALVLAEAVFGEFEATRDDERDREIDQRSHDEDLIGRERIG